MSQFKSLNTNLYKKKKPIETSDSTYWNKLGAPVIIKEFGPINYINFSLIDPYYFAVTSSVRVQIYNPITKLVVKNFPRFRENAYGATFRSDGKLLCTGGEEKVVKLFNVQSKGLVRLFKGHTAPVHRTLFVIDKPQIASFSDDKSVKIWDIATEQSTQTFSDHSDYIRAGAISPALPDIILSGSYDKTVKMYDTRTNSTVLTVDHGSPVESILFLPSGGIFLSAGGTDIKIWDSAAGGKLIGNISQHHKTITCLHLALNNKRLFSGSLDRHVKIYDTNNFQVVHTMDYPNPVLSLGVSHDNNTVVVGLLDGIISVKRRETTELKNEDRKIISHKYTAKIHTKVDSVYSKDKLRKQRKFDVCFRKFEYMKVLTKQVAKSTKYPIEMVEVLQELMRRKALARVLADCNNVVICQILKFFSITFSDSRFTNIIITCINIFLDVHGSRINDLPKPAQVILRSLTNRIRNEIMLMQELAKIQGSMDMILASSKIDSSTIMDVKSLDNLVPSADASEIPIVNLT